MIDELLTQLLKNCRYQPMCLHSILLLFRLARPDFPGGPEQIPRVVTMLIAQAELFLEQITDVEAIEKIKSHFI